MILIKWIYYIYEFIFFLYQILILNTQKDDSGFAFLPQRTKSVFCLRLVQWSLLHTPRPHHDPASRTFLRSVLHLILSAMLTRVSSLCHWESLISLVELPVYSSALLNCQRLTVFNKILSDQSPVSGVCILVLQPPSAEHNIFFWSSHFSIHCINIVLWSRRLIMHVGKHTYILRETEVAMVESGTRETQTQLNKPKVKLHFTLAITDHLPSF